VSLWRIFLKWVSLGIGLWLIFISTPSFAYQWGWDGRYIYGKTLSSKDVELFKELVCLPDRFWVNLSPTLSPEDVLPGRLWAGQVGQILLDADLKLKKLSKEVIGNKLDWDEDVLFRVMIFIRYAEVDLYKNGKAVDGIRLGVRFFAEDKEWEERFNKYVAPYIEREVNTSPDFADLRRLVGLYALSRTGKCHPLDRVFMGQEWNDKDGALEEYRKLFEDGVVGGVEIDSKNFQERSHPNSLLPVVGKDRIALTETPDSEHKKILFMAKENAKQFLTKLNRSFLPEERLLGDLIPLGVVDKHEYNSPTRKEEGVYAFSLGELRSRSVRVLVDPIDEIWSNVRQRYWQEVKKKLKDETTRAVSSVDPEGEYLWSVEGGIRGKKVFIYQIRPIRRVKDREEKFPKKEEFKHRLLRVLRQIKEALGGYGIDLKDAITAVEEGRLKDGTDLVLTQLWTTYSKNKEIGKTFVKVAGELPEEDEKVLWDWVLLFPTTGMHFSVSLLLDAISSEKGVDFLVDRVSDVVNLADQLGQSGLGRWGGYKFGAKKDGDYGEVGDEPLFGLGGAIVLWPALFGKDSGVKERYRKFLTLCRERFEEGKIFSMVEKTNRFLRLGNESFFDLLDEDIKEVLGEFGIGKKVGQEKKIGQEETERKEGTRHIVMDDLSFSVVIKGRFGDTVIGRVRVIASPEDIYKVRDGDILIIKNLPTNYPQIEGLPSCIIALEDVVEGQHVVLYVRQMGVPLIKLQGDYSLDYFRQLEGAWVELDLTKRRLHISEEGKGDLFIKNIVLPYKKRLVEGVKTSITGFLERDSFSTEIAIANLKNALPASEFGAKSARLSDLVRAGVNVPEGIVVSLGLLRWVLDRVEFDWESWREEFEKSVQEGTATSELRNMARDIQKRILNVGLDDFLDRLWEDLGSLKEKKIIVRSVSSVEDRRFAPFVGTGILDSIRLKKGDKKELGEVIKKVLSSMFSPNSLLEKINLGIDPTKVGMGVIIQEAIIEDVGFVGEVGEGEIRFDVVLGNNSVITAEGNRMGTGIDFPWSDRVVFNPTVSRENRLKGLFYDGDIYVKALRFWREAILSIQGWRNEDERLAWVELWNRLLMGGNDDLLLLVREGYQGILRTIKNREGKLGFEDKLLLYYLPFVVLYRDLPEGLVLKGILKEGLTSVDISALQVISKVRPDIFSLKQLKRLMEGDSIDKQRLAVNLIWYASDPDGVVRGVELGGKERKEKGGIEFNIER